MERDGTGWDGSEREGAGGECTVRLITSSNAERTSKSTF